MPPNCISSAVNDKCTATQSEAMVSNKIYLNQYKKINDHIISDSLAAQYITVTS